MNSIMNDIAISCVRTLLMCSLEIVEASCGTRVVCLVWKCHQAEFCIDEGLLLSVCQRSQLFADGHCLGGASDIEECPICDVLRKVMACCKCCSVDIPD